MPDVVDSTGNEKSIPILVNQQEIGAENSQFQASEIVTTTKSIEKNTHKMLRRSKMESANQIESMH